MSVLNAATCQFPVSADIGANLRWVKRQMTVAARRGARAAHFPEGALSGYAGIDFPSFEGAPASRVAEVGDAIGTRFAAVNPAATFTYPGITIRDGGRAAQRDAGPRSALGGPDEPVAADKRSLNLLSPRLRPAPTLGSRTKEGVGR